MNGVVEFLLILAVGFGLLYWIINIGNEENPSAPTEKPTEKVPETSSAQPLTAIKATGKTSTRRKTTSKK